MTETPRQKPSMSPQQKVESALEQFREANVKFGQLMLDGCGAETHQARRAMEDADAYGSQLVQARRELMAEQPTIPLQAIEI